MEKVTKNKRPIYVIILILIYGAICYWGLLFVLIMIAFMGIGGDILKWSMIPVHFIGFIVLGIVIVRRWPYYSWRTGILLAIPAVLLNILPTINSLRNNEESWTYTLGILLLHMFAIFTGAILGSYFGTRSSLTDRVEIG